MIETEGLALSLLFRKRRSRAGNHKSYEVDSWIDLKGYTLSLPFLLKALSSSTLSGLLGR